MGPFHIHDSGVGVCQSVVVPSAHSDAAHLSQLLFDYSNDGIALIDEHGLLTAANPAFEKITGFRREEWIGRHFGGLSHPDELQSSLEKFEAALRGEPIPIFESLVLTRSGEFRPVEHNPKAILKDGRFLGVLLITRDISKRKAEEEQKARILQEQAARTIAETSEKQLRNSETWLMEMLDTAPVMLWISDTSGALTFFNRPWTEFTGRTLSQDIGFGWKEIIHADDLNQSLKTYLSNFEKRLEYRSEYRMLRRDGVYRWILEAGAPRFNTEGNFIGYIGSCIDISSQKETEAKLRQSEERYRLVARSTNDTIWDWDLLPRHLDRNESQRRFWGDELEATASRIHYWFQAIHPDDRERVWQSVHHAIENRVQRWVEEYRYQRSDGTYYYVSDRGYLLYDQGGRPARMIGAMTDITERKRAEEELQRSEMRYRLAARATSHAIWDWDLISNRIHWSDAVMTTFHYKVEELGPFAQWWYEHIHEEDRDRVVQGIHKVIDEGGQHWSDEYRFLCGDGKYKSVIDRGFVVHDGHGVPVRMIGAMMDITERILAEAESRRFKFISDNSNDAHFLVNEEGQILYANKVACEKLGYAKEELLTKTIDVIDLEMDNREKFLGQFKEGYKRGTLLFETVHVDKRGNRFPVEVSAVLVQFEGERHVFLIARDIAERKRAEFALKLQAEELARSNAELQQFAYVASHDLQEPLRMVNSYLTLLARKYGNALDRDAHEYIRFAVDGALRMHALINDLLVYSRVGTRDKCVQIVDLNGVFDAALANLRPAIDESSAEVTRDELPKVLADKIQMTQLFQNLLGNAIKFRGVGAPAVHVGAAKQNGEWIISIQDNGIGIDRKFINRIFVIFQRLHTRDEYPGTGIGLAICKKIVERHGGRIWVEPQEQGTLFRFTMKVGC